MRRYSYVLVFAALLLALSFLSVLPALSSDDAEDKYVRLMSAQSVQLIEIDGKSYRKAEGPARFLHNDTWLICDTALWSVDEQLIYAIGNVSIEQDETELRGDSLTYIIDRDLAMFRGHVVELLDKDGNTLRTSNLDYNTKDSVAVFRDGGSMKDNLGQVIESVEGTYDSKAKLFTFRDKVEMFTDSVFIKTSLLFYNTNQETATFPEYVEAWKEDKMLSAMQGWYIRGKERFFFTDNVHTLSEDKEGWCDSLFFNKLEKDVVLLGNAQITDTVRNVTSMGGYIHYTDSLSKVVMTKDPVVVMKLEDDDAYARADTIYYWIQKKCDIDTAVISQAQNRLRQIEVDPVANIRAKAAEELARKIKEAEENDPNTPPQIQPGSGFVKPGGRPAVGQSGKPAGEFSGPEAAPVPLDSAALAQRDSIARADSIHRADSIAAIPPDTTQIGFMLAVHKVKIFRPKMQVICDSLIYCDLDSIARLFKSPVVWNENHQYNSDSLFIVLDSGRMKKANLLSNAFIHIEEEVPYYDQIRATEMMAYFNDSTKLSRFDALGSVTALFFFNEKGRISTANHKEASMLSAEFTDGQVSKISYYEAPKSNAYPVAQMRQDEKYLKGFKWIKEQCPKSPADLTARVPRESERSMYVSRPRTAFKQTDIYFPGYFEQVYKDIARSDSLRRVRKSSPGQADATAASETEAALGAVAGGVAGLPVAADSTDVADSPAVRDSVSLADSVVTLPRIPPGYVPVHPDDNKHKGTRWLGHVSVVDSLGCPVNLDSLQLKLYVDSTSSRFHLPDTLPAAVLVDTSDVFMSIDSTGMSLVIVEFTGKELKRMAAEDARAAALAAKEARWKKLDEADAAKKAAREAKKQAKAKARQEKLLKKMAERQAQELLIKEAYKAAYLKKMMRSEGY